MKNTMEELNKETMNITHIVPRMPPSICGVGDYSYLLASEIYKKYGINSHFIICDPMSETDSKSKFHYTKLAKHSHKHLLKILQKNNAKIVILHFSGYGYSKKGCPLWIANFLKLKEDIIVITMFHELYAVSKNPLKTSFWLSYIQKRIVKNIANYSDFCVTNTTEYAKKIKQISGKNSKSLPVFSNVGEPDTFIPWNKRKRNLLLFGSLRPLIYTKYLKHLYSLCRVLNIESIIDVGKIVKPKIASLKGIPIVKKGILPRKEIMQIMANCIVGYSSPHSNNLKSKSGTIAAFCANGLVPLIPNTTTSPSSVSREILHLNYILKAENKYFKVINDIKLEDIEEIALNNYRLYQSHTLNIHADEYTKIILELFKKIEVKKAQ
jgi:hypothetical protein